MTVHVHLFSLLFTACETFALTGWQPDTPSPRRCAVEHFTGGKEGKLATAKPPSREPQGEGPHAIRDLAETVAILKPLMTGADRRCPHVNVVWAI
jgi:hypothetical protein